MALSKQSYHKVKYDHCFIWKQASVALQAWWDCLCSGLFLNRTNVLQEIFSAATHHMSSAFTHFISTVSELRMATSWPQIDKSLTKSQINWGFNQWIFHCWDITVVIFHRTDPVQDVKDHKYLCSIHQNDNLKFLFLSIHNNNNKWTNRFRTKIKVQTLLHSGYHELHFIATRGISRVDPRLHFKCLSWVIAM